jgi:hypothetical protein
MKSLIPSMCFLACLRAYKFKKNHAMFIYFFFFNLITANNGYDVESLTDSQTWTYNERGRSFVLQLFWYNFVFEINLIKINLFYYIETNKIVQDYPQRYQQSPSNDFSTTSYDTNTLPKHYGLASSPYNDVSYL